MANELVEEIEDVVAECSTRELEHNLCDFVTANNLVVNLERCCLEVEAYVAGAMVNMDDSTLAVYRELYTCLSHMLWESRVQIFGEGGRGEVLRHSGRPRAQLNVPLVSAL